MLLKLLFNSTSLVCLSTQFTELNDAIGTQYISRGKPNVLASISVTSKFKFKKRNNTDKRNGDFCFCYKKKKCIKKKKNVKEILKNQ